MRGSFDTELQGSFGTELQGSFEIELCGSFETESQGSFEVELHGSLYPDSSAPDLSYAAISSSFLREGAHGFNADLWIIRTYCVAFQASRFIYR